MQLTPAHDLIIDLFVALQKLHAMCVHAHQVQKRQRPNVVFLQLARIVQDLFALLYLLHLFLISEQL